MKCTKCSSENVNVQAISEVTKKHRGIIYWLLIGWWLEALMWIFLTLPWLIVKIFSPKRYKSKITKQAVCQSCGHSWSIR